MIQFNLLPDVKLEFIKIRRIKHLAMGISTIVVIASVSILIILLGIVDGLQKRSLDNLNSSIISYTNKINGVPNLNKILTIQNQLNSLPALESQKPIVSPVFGYLNQITPSNITISSVKLDLSKGTIEVQGDANSLATIDQYVDTFKFTTYSTGVNKQTGSAFSNVVLSSFSVSGQISYDIQADYNAALFNSADNTQLSVPSEISTRSVLDQPKLFSPQPASTTSTTNNNQPQ